MSELTFKAFHDPAAGRPLLRHGCDRGTPLFAIPRRGANSHPLGRGPRAKETVANTRFGTKRPAATSSSLEPVDRGSRLCSAPTWARFGRGDGTRVGLRSQPGAQFSV